MAHSVQYKQTDVRLTVLSPSVPAAPQFCALSRSSPAAVSPAPTHYAPLKCSHNSMTRQLMSDASDQMIPACARDTNVTNMATVIAVINVPGPLNLKLTPSRCNHFLHMSCPTTPQNVTKNTLITS